MAGISRDERVWIKQTPSRHISINNLPNDASERELVLELTRMEMPFDDIRFIPKRGLYGQHQAFIEFATKKAAVEWMEKLNGQLALGQGRMCQLMFSKRDDDDGEMWLCACGYSNLHRRQACFKCSLKRPEKTSSTDTTKNVGNGPGKTSLAADACAEEGYTSTSDGTDQRSDKPASTVLLRGLDGFTDEKKLLEAWASVTSLQPTGCFVMRNLQSNVSLGYAFMEFDSVENAERVVTYCNKVQPFEADGKLLMVDFAKNSFKIMIAAVALAKEQYNRLKAAKEDPFKNQNIAPITKYRLLEETNMSKSSARHTVGSSAEVHSKRVHSDQFSSRGVDSWRSSLDNSAADWRSIIEGSAANQQVSQDEFSLYLVQQRANEQLESENLKKQSALESPKVQAPQTGKEQIKSKAIRSQRTDGDETSSYTREEETGFLFDSDTGLYKDRGQFVPETSVFVGHSMANSLDLRIFDDKEIVPNGRLDDLVTTAVKLLNSGTLRKKLVSTHIFFGITDLLDVKQSIGYREVVLRDACDLLLSKLEWANCTLNDKRTLPIFCTFPPLSFAKHNEYLLKTGITNRLDHKAKYAEMQTKLNEMVAKVNTKVHEINVSNGVATCYLSKKLFLLEGGKYILREPYLKDGLHLSNQGATLLNLELAQNLRKVKEGKKSPDWLKSTPETKQPKAPISFTVKKRVEQNKVDSSSWIENRQEFTKSFADRDRSRSNSQERKTSRSRSRSRTRDKQRKTQNDWRKSSPSHETRKSRISDEDRFPVKEQEQYNEMSDRGRQSLLPYPEMGAKADPYSFQQGSSRIGRPSLLGGPSLLGDPSLLGEKPQSLLGDAPSNMRFSSSANFRTKESRFQTSEEMGNFSSLSHQWNHSNSADYVDRQQPWDNVNPTLRFDSNNRQHSRWY